MKPEMNEEQFTELRKLLALKRYERPPTEFRSEFMAEFSRRRQEMDAYRGWVSRLWLWLTPDWTGALRNAAATAIVALVVANIVVVQSRPRVSRSHLAVITSPTVTTAEDSSTLLPPLPYATVEPSSNEIAYYFLWQNVHDQAEKIYGENTTMDLMQSVNFVAEDSDDAL